MKKLQDPGLSVPRIYSRFVTFKYINSHSAFAIQSIFYLFSDHTTSPFPFTRHWLLFSLLHLLRSHSSRTVYPSVLDLMECYRLLVPQFYGVANDRGSHLQLKLRASVGTELLELRRLP